MLKTLSKFSKSLIRQVTSTLSKAGWRTAHDAERKEDDVPDDAFVCAATDDGSVRGRVPASDFAGGRPGRACKFLIGKTFLVSNWQLRYDQLSGLALAGGKAGNN